jgi:hypothetical protein
MGIIPAFVDRASLETGRYAFVIKMRKALWIMLQFAFCPFGHQATPGLLGVCDDRKYGVFINRHQVVKCHTPCGC